MKNIRLMLIVSMFWGQPTTVQAMQADERVESLVVQAARAAARLLEDRVGRVLPGNVDQADAVARGLLTEDGGLPAEVRNRVVRSYGMEHDWQCAPRLECTYETRGVGRRYTHVGYAVGGRLIAVEVAGTEVRLYDGNTHEMVDRCAWDCRACMPYAVHVGAQGALAASGTRRVRVHNVGSGQLMRLFNIKKRKKRHGLGAISALALNPNDVAVVCVGFTDGTAQLFDRQTQQVVTQWSDRDASVGAVAYHPHGRLVAGAWSSVVKLFDVRTKDVVRELRNPEEFVGSLAFDTTGCTLSLCSHDGTVRTYVQQADPSDNLAQTLLEIAGARALRRPAAEREAQARALVTSAVFSNHELREQMQLLDNLERRAQDAQSRGMASIFALRREELQADQ